MIKDFETERLSWMIEVNPCNHKTLYKGGTRVRGDVKMEAGGSALEGGLQVLCSWL